MCSLVTKINDERKLLDRLPLAGIVKTDQSEQINF